MNKKVSIVVPIYNVEKYLDKCINSLVNQTYQDIEILLIDDGSTDKSGKIAEDWAKKDSRTNVYHKTNGGLSDARNYGIKKASGSYICFIDSDDWVEKNYIERLLLKIYENDCDISICNPIYDFENGVSKIKQKKNNKSNYIMNSEEAILELNNFRYFDMSACFKLFKKELFNNIKFPKEKYCEDFYIMFKLFDKANKIVYFNEYLYHYMQRKGSISHNNNNLRYDFIYAAYQQMIFVEKKYPRLKNIVRSAYVSSILTIYNKSIENKVLLSADIKEKFDTEVKNNYKYVKGNSQLPFIKKVQIFLFSKNKVVYKIFFKLYKLIFKV